MRAVRSSGTVCHGMELVDYVETRRRRYLAQALTPFDESVDPVLKQLPISPEERDRLDERIEGFKRGVRKSFENFTNDVTDYLNGVDSPHINAKAVELRDRVR